MKKIILSIITLTFSAFASAQMKVYNNGKVTIGLESQDSESQFSVGSTNTYSLFPVILETKRIRHIHDTNMPERRIEI